MGKKLGLFIACLLMATSMAFAQKNITGTVVDDLGEPLPGANVKVVGTTIAALTDVNGKFTLSNLPQNARTVTVSYMGMKTIQAAIRNNMRIAMVAELKEMNEVMVVAYGSSTKASFTGSATVLGTENLEVLQSSNALDALTGHVAGVELFSPTGDPTNNRPAIRIRGISSMGAGVQPLIVIDGAPFPGDMATINTADIESMTILKDAAATALYGARAANGVIIITTKKGKVGETARVTLDAKWGSNSRAQREYKTISNPAQYYETYYTALNNYAVNKLGYDATAANLWANSNVASANSYGLGMNVFNVPAGQLMIGLNGKMNPYATLGNVVNYKGQDYLLTPDDWMKETYRHGLRQEYNVNISNATDKSSFYASFGYTNNQGIIQNSSMETINGRLKADLQVKDWLKVGANMGFSHYNSQSMQEDGDASRSGNIFAAATQVAPIYPVYIRNGLGQIMTDAYGLKMYDWADGANAGTSRPYLTGSNALQQQILDVTQWNGNAANANGFLEIRFAKDFKFTSNNTFNFDEARSTGLTNPYYGNYASSNGILSKGHSRDLSFDFIQQLNWSHQWDKHDVEVMAAHDWFQSRGYSLSATKSNMFDPSNLEFGGAITDGSNAGSSYAAYNNEGWRFRAQYNYAQKYFISASYNREASSRFAVSHRWGNFYSIGGAWVISDEEFMKDIKWLDFLKYKLSYGEIGNDRIDDYLYTNRYGVINSAGNVALVPSTTLKNEKITWETVGEMNTGIEFSIYNGRLSGGIEYFWRNTSDMLYKFSLPISTGYSGYFDNIGDMVNHGVELELNADLVRTNDITWSVGLNLTHYKNIVKYMPEEKKTVTAYGFDGKTYGGYPDGSAFVGEGLSLGTYFMPVYAGIYSQDTWETTKDIAYDPSKAGMSLWWKSEIERDDLGEIVVDERGSAVLTNDKYTTTEYDDATQYVTGDGLLPKLYGGLNTSLQAYGFDFTLDFAYQIGGQVYDSDYASFMGSPLSSGSRGFNMHADILNAWTPENTGSDIPRLQFNDVNSASQSTRFLTKASYLSLQNLTFGYTLPQSLTRRASIEKVRVYLNASNVWLWSARQGLDPRTAANNYRSGSGANSAVYSPVRTISAGVSVTF